MWSTPFVCEQNNSKSFEWISMKFPGNVLNDPMNNWLDFGSDCRVHTPANEDFLILQTLSDSFHLKQIKFSSTFTQ